MIKLVIFVHCYSFSCLIIGLSARMFYWSFTLHMQ